MCRLKIHQPGSSQRLVKHFRYRSNFLHERKLTSHGVKADPLNRVAVVV